MPVIFPWVARRGVRRGPVIEEPRALGGQVPTVQREGPRPALEVRGPPGPINNPRVAKGTVASAVMQTITARIGAEVADLGSSSLGPLNTRSIPNMHDAVELLLLCSSTYSSGAAVTGSMQATTGIQQVNVRKADGTVIMSVLSEHLHSYFERFSKWTKDFTDTAVTVVASQTNATGPASNIRLPVRLPAKYGPYNLDLIYSNLAGVGSWGTDNAPVKTAATGLTAFKLTVQQEVLYGDAGGYESHLIPATFGGLAPGVNDIAQTYPVKNKAIAEMALYGFADDTTELEKIILITNGMAIEPHLTVDQLKARDEDAIQANRPTAANGVLYWLYPTSQFSVNSTTQFQMFLVAGATTVTVKTWIYYLEPAA